jgi:hypothetical protein
MSRLLKLNRKRDRPEFAPQESHCEIRHPGGECEAPKVLSAAGFPIAQYL